MSYSCFDKYKEGPQHTNLLTLLLESVGAKGKPPQDVPLQHVNYAQVENSQGPKDLESSSFTQHQVALSSAPAPPTGQH